MHGRPEHGNRGPGSAGPVLNHLAGSGCGLELVGLASGFGGEPFQDGPGVLVEEGLEGVGSFADTDPCLGGCGGPVEVGAGEDDATANGCEEVGDEVMGILGGRRWVGEVAGRLRLARIGVEGRLHDCGEKPGPGGVGLRGDV